MNAASAPDLLANRPARLIGLYPALKYIRNYNFLENVPEIADMFMNVFANP